MAPNADRDGYVRLIEARSDIGGRYTGLQRIGANGGDGHFSLVFSATDGCTGRRVAIKVFRPDRLPDTYRFQCFAREAVLLEQLSGTPNILDWVGAKDEFIEVITSSTGIPIPPLRFPYFAVELALTDVGTIIRAGHWSLDQTLVTFREMCKAVRRIHKCGIVHRDIKPSNFLRMPNGDVKLSDFGTARYANGAEPPILAIYQAAPGDRRYTSPEMHALLHDDDPEIARTGDIFSLGATLFEMCTGAILGVQIFDSAFASDLARAMGAVHKRERARTYLGFVQSLDAGHPLPSISDYVSDVPSSIRNLVDQLYKGMAALDYRRRLGDFEIIFLKIDQCLLVLRNEEKVRRWRRQKELYRQNRKANLAHRAAMIAAAKRRETP